MSKRRLPAADRLDPVRAPRAKIGGARDEPRARIPAADHQAARDPSPDPAPDRNTRMRQARAERGLRQPAREGAGRPAEAGVAREERVAVPVTAAEKEALRALAAGRPLAELLREAPARAARWRAVADGLADALGGEGEDAALDAYIAACQGM